MVADGRGGGIVRAAEQGGEGCATTNKCWYPSWIFAKNRVSADSAISAKGHIPFQLVGGWGYFFT